MAALSAIPRALKAAVWYARATAAYKALSITHPDPAEPRFQEALAGVHQSLAPSLLQLCEANGGIYIKAAQLATTVTAVPQQYRM